MTRNAGREAAPPAQLALDFELRPALSADDFLVAAPNAEAVGLLDSWPDWPGPAAVVVGPAGSGKTHLAKVFQAMTGAPAVTAAALAVDEAPAIVGDAPAAVLDDAETAVSGGLEAPLLHLHNTLAETDRHLLLTARRPPARWGIGLADLASRLNAATQAAIGAPTDELVQALLVKQFADRQLRVDTDVISFLIPRMERSFEAARRIVGAVDALALEERRNITVPLVKRVLERTNPA